MRFSTSLTFVLTLYLTAHPGFAVFLANAGSPANSVEKKPNVPGQLLVKIDPNVPIKTISYIESQFGARKLHSYKLVEGLHLYQFDPNLDVEDVIDSLSSYDAVIYAEPDFIYQIATPKADVNDPEFGRQWALENNGQNGGTIDADINAETMWRHQSGSKDIVIGIIDTGIDYTHPDLVANVWTNPGEIPGNGIDEDGNGYIDDVHGANAIKSDGNPMDDNVHGTHVAGTIGAIGNNSVGVSGVAQSVQIAACKFLSSGGSGSISDAIKCMDYFAALKSRALNPVNLIATNNSWGGGGRSQAMLDAIKAHESLGILFIAAAGNESSNNDVTDSFPANYDVSNVISVAATDNQDRLAVFSNYGKRTVHVAAPGVKILSTVLGHKYGELSGTSMATPHVTGMAAILASQFRSLDYAGIKNLIMAGGQRIASTINTTKSGRRLRGADIDGIGSLTCKNQTVINRMQPVPTTYRLALGKSLFLSALHINCAASAGPLSVYQGHDGPIVLNDNGENGDLKANDGIVSLMWTPSAAGTYELRFSDNDIVTVTVTSGTSLQPYVAHELIPFEYEIIGGKRLNAGDDTMHYIVSPFPIFFGGSSDGFANLYISSNGTVSFTEQNQPGHLNQSLPTTLATTLVAPYWDDLETAGKDSDIYVKVLGLAPDRKLVVEWWKIKQFHAPGLGAFQVVFFENKPDIQFNYLDTHFYEPDADYGGSATVGVQTGQDNALQYSFNEHAIHSNSSILFSLAAKL